jgi:plasmid maintenance system antidote protein VapI
MPSFRISIRPSRRAAARIIAKVRRALQKALVEQSQASGLSQSDIARAIGVHRSVINRELRGQKDITLGRVGELAWALGRTIVFELQAPASQNLFAQPPTAAGLNREHVSYSSKTVSTSSDAVPAPATATGSQPQAFQPAIAA